MIALVADSSIMFGQCLHLTNVPAGGTDPRVIATNICEHLSHKIVVSYIGFNPAS